MDIQTEIRATEAIGSEFIRMRQVRKPIPRKGNWYRIGYCLRYFNNNKAKLAGKRSKALTNSTSN